jgi:hypothetical protein
MRNELATGGDRNEKAQLPKAAQNETQPAVAEAHLVKITEPSSSNLAARVTRVRAKVAKFVDSLFSKSIHFAKGE